MQRGSQVLGPMRGSCRRLAGLGRRRSRSSGRLRDVLEDRTLLSVDLISHYDGLDLSSSTSIPPTASGAAGPSSYVETVNQTVGNYSLDPVLPKDLITKELSNENRTIRDQDV